MPGRIHRKLADLFLNINLTNVYLNVHVYRE